MLLISITILGAVMNKIRGGLIADFYLKHLVKHGYHPDYAREKAEKFWKPFAKHFNHVVFALVFMLALKPIYQTQGLLCLVLLSAGMLGGSSWGWGGYIDSAVEKKIDHNRDDVKLLDKWFRGNDEPVLSGWAAMSVRGFMWTGCIAISFILMKAFGVAVPNKVFLIAPVGLSMGTCYLVSMEICQRLPYMKRGNGWQVGEYVFGAVVWGSLVYFLGV